MTRLLQITLSIIWVWMVYIVVSTSLESSLFEQWDFLAAIPWMRATLWDFYANILIIYLYVLFRERNVIVKLLCAVLFFCLGSIASIAYVLIQLIQLKEGQPIMDILKPKSLTK